MAFAPDGGVEKLVQTGDFQYHEPSPNPDTGGRAMFAANATYTPADEILVLRGSPRAIDGGMTTTADVLRINRQSGEAFADNNVKTTYSDLKPQPDGALLATSDPVHVTAQHMVSKQQPGVAHYTGNVRLWQTANVVRAPAIDFDQQNRTLIAHADTAKSVSSLFVQQGQDGKLTPVDVTADKLTYVDAERRARYSGNVFVKSPTGTVSAQQIDIYLKPADASGYDAGRQREIRNSGHRRPQPPRSHGRHRQGCRDRTQPPRRRRPAGLSRPTTANITLRGKPPAFLMPNTARFGAIR